MKEHIRTIILKLLTLEAKAVLRKHKPQVMVVTGSVGKTSTKDAAFTALGRHTFVRKSEKSYNSDIGVPLTILGVPNGWSNIFVWLQNLLRGLFLVVSSTPYPKWLIIEIGADRPGDISQALSWVRPDVVVTTRFPDVPVHVEYYESPEAVIAEELFPVSLLTDGGVAVLNYDDSHAREVKTGSGVKRLTYGFGKDADVRAMRYKITARKGVLTGVSFDVVCGEEKVHITLTDVVGMGHVYAVLAGIAGAIGAGVPLGEAVHGFETHTPPPGRLHIVAGKKETSIIDDTYNSSPAAVEEALAALEKAPAVGKRIAVLGDMLELGSYSVGEHARIGALCNTQTDILVAVGVRAKGIATGARDSGMPESRVHSFERNQDAIEFLETFIETRDIILIKGSQGMRMERITKALMAEPGKAASLLCRQDPEWLAR